MACGPVTGDIADDRVVGDSDKADAASQCLAWVVEAVKVCLHAWVRWSGCGIGKATMGHRRNIADRRFSENHRAA